MTQRRAFVRKIVYLVCIALLLIPLYWISNPSTVNSPGGHLAQIRTEHGLSQAELGQIDPTGETIKLATLGMRGIAVNILWLKSNTYAMKKDWVGMSAVLEQIARLEPHFISVWRHQAWRVSYNVSVEFDDYRGRYHWVIKGINFLKEGIDYNKHEPVLYWDVGWFTAQKIGRADESKQYRKLFREDDDFHGARLPEARDNWLVGKEWFAEAEKLVDEGYPLKGTSPVIFFSDRPMCQMNYAEALQADGIFGDKTKQAWEKAHREWVEEYGVRDIPTTYGTTIRLNDREEFEKVIQQEIDELNKIAPGVRAKVEQEKIEALSEEEKLALDTDSDDRTDQQRTLAYEANDKINVSHKEVADRVQGAQRARALELADHLEEIEEENRIIRSYRQIVNFEYWRNHARIEQSDEAINARRSIYQAEMAIKNADQVAAKKHFEVGMASWRKILDDKQYQDLRLLQDETIGLELLRIIEQYQQLLDLLDEPIPEKIILQDIYDLNRDRPPTPRGAIPDDPEIKDEKKS